MRAPSPPSLVTIARLVSAILATLILAGCETYAETVSCGMGLVLDDDDRCVAPPAPDGGASVSTCSELCDAIGDFSDARRSCLEDGFAAFGTLPPSCVGLMDRDGCLACVADVGAVDTACAGAAAACP